MVKELKLKSRIDNSELSCLVTQEMDCAGIINNPLCWLEFVDNDKLPSGLRNHCRCCALNTYVCDEFRCYEREDGREGIWRFRGPGIVI